MVGVMSNDDMLFRRKDRKSWTTDTPHLPRLYKLIYRMATYLEYAIVSVYVYTYSMSRTGVGWDEW